MCRNSRTETLMIPADFLKRSRSYFITELFIFLLRLFLCLVCVNVSFLICFLTFLLFFLCTNNLNSFFSLRKLGKCIFILFLFSCVFLCFCYKINLQYPALVFKRTCLLQYGGHASDRLHSAAVVTMTTELCLH